MQEASTDVTLPATAPARGAKPIISGRVGARTILDGREVILLTANNYLGLAGDSEVIERSCAAAREYGSVFTARTQAFCSIPAHPRTSLWPVRLSARATASSATGSTTPASSMVAG
jgi:7-keto-8-aminopelargonate synthetase-like enzyme